MTTHDRLPDPSAAPRSARRRWVGAAMTAQAMALGAALLHTPATAQGPGMGPPVGFGGPGGFGQEERKLVAQFDANGDERLDAAERAAARAAIGSQGGGRGGFRGGGRGGFGGGRVVAGTPGARITPAEARSYPNAGLYDTNVLRTIFLQFDNPDWEQELAAFHNTDVEVPATAIVDGVTYKDVGVHFRGASSFMMVPEGSKRSLNLSFDFVDEDQAIGGYRTLNLLNANGDPTFLRTVLYTHIANQYLPTPRANFVRVVINGESWGVYVSAQQFNKDLLRDFFGTTEGARWKVPGSPRGRGGMEYLGDDIEQYKRIYDIKTKNDPKRWVDLVNLFRVLNQTPPAQLEEALKPILDVDGVLKFLALEVALVNSDGYWTRASDYNIYQDPSGRFHVIAHDVNEAMGAGGGNVTLDPLVGLDDPAKPLRSRLLAVPALRERYLGYVREIAQKWMDWKTVEPLVAQYQTLIAADVRADTRKLYSNEAFETGIAGSPNSLRGFLERRREVLLK